MSEDTKTVRFDPPYAPPKAPNPDYLPSSEEARAGLYSKYAKELALYSSYMERYANGYAERVKRAGERKATRRSRGR